MQRDNSIEDKVKNPNFPNAQRSDLFPNWARHAAHMPPRSTPCRYSDLLERLSIIIVKNCKTFSETTIWRCLNHRI